MSDYDTELARALRPRTRGDCVRGPRPCPWLGCRYHLAPDRLVLNHGRRGPGATLAAIEAALDVDLYTLPETCALDVADLGEHSLEELAVLLDRSRQGVAVIEDAALTHAARALAMLAAREPEAAE